MNIATEAGNDQFARAQIAVSGENGGQRWPLSAVSWSAILAGALGAAALSLILVILGIGLGLSSVSPWRYEGVSATTFSVSTIIWLILTQLLASGMGGYLAGRLRTKWGATHRDEVYFRDTAHGFLTWAVASLVTAVLLSSAIGSIVRVGASVAGSVATVAVQTAATGGALPTTSQVAQTNNADGPTAYLVGSLLRGGDVAAANAAPSQSDPGRDQIRGTAAAEIVGIFVNAMRLEKSSLPPEDSRYVAQVVAQQIGLPQPEAEKRTGEAYASARATLRNAEVAAKQAADKARKASAYASLWIFVALLSGAFVASLAATYGGRQRDL